VPFKTNVASPKFDPKNIFHIKIIWICVGGFLASRGNSPNFKPKIVSFSCCFRPKTICLVIQASEGVSSLWASRGKAGTFTPALTRANGVTRCPELIPTIPQIFHP
jgi:hypothetical protein